ncbi:DUF5916 domain-containing protein [Polaribacter porphyrae]|uniref:Uncharacterized protein n=1 Tax=Polaribacter porphyrae TaxID=1137780 RepID=A0A2S7WKH1_9FLAO|nr:DUF5916 domain-containing protein [Polaribacter porphyrae]PQJ78117.1 hypothetical protein BTO18_02420 [Polaribacter porphyrae]
MFKKNLLLLIVCFSIYQFTAQTKKERKTIKALRIEKAPKIDGVLDDEAWNNAEIATNFVVFRPENGEAVKDEYQTTVKVVYDDNAIYISAQMNDPDPANIPKEFAVRDNFTIADFFLVTINPNDDGQNPFEFIVQSTGNQADANISNGREDFNWSAVWDSSAKIDEKGWNVEMEIPYRALRFANRKVQEWGFNFHRRLELLNEQHTWTFVDNSVGRWTQYDGLVTELRNIKPPTRLNLYPYASAVTNTFEGTTDFDWNVGMDIKYGLTENFTLDATLVPDFSQVGFDDVVLNLGPFEQQFTEQRQFFTEGTELFNIANLFYSRRIGGPPIDQFDVSSTLNANEEIIDYPNKTTMINAIKVSGRTKNGLGIGFFNAITQKAEATIKDNQTGQTRKEVIDPFTNYNILVLDQQFNQNSTISLINTNVTRDGRFRDANVTAMDWHIETKDSRYNADGSVRMSTISDDPNNPNTGWTFDNSFGYNSGNWFWEVGYNFENKDFNPNDLGILFTNDQQTIYGNLGWRTVKATKNFNRIWFNSYHNINFQHFSGTYTGYFTGIGGNAQTKERFSFGGFLNYGSEEKDFFEPRQGTTSGQFFLQPERLNVNGFISTNSQKKLALNVNGYYTGYTNNPKVGYGYSFSPRYRFNNQFSLRYRLRFNKTNDDQGYVDETANNIIFGFRDRKNYTNTIAGKYSFNTNSSLSLSFRHFWEAVSYISFNNLNAEGGLDPNTTYQGDNVNFNSWNLDLNYIWQFAPGSQLIAFYRNSIFNSNTNSNLNFFENIENLFDQSQRHTISVRFVYFIDYNRLKNIF